MTGSTDLDALLRGLSPRLDDGEYVFVSIPGARYGDHAELEPVGSFEESEGLTLILRREDADRGGLAYDVVLARIVLEVESSLNAVGLTAAVSGRLAEAGISANVVAAFHHDHVFVPVNDASRALDVLRALQRGE